MPEEKSKENKVEDKAKPRERNLWIIIGAIAAGIILIAGFGGGYMVHLSNTSPQFCQTCHLMEKNVSSYLTSDYMDNTHYLANVQCKDCHDYPIPAEVTSGFRYLTGNYSVDTNGDLLKVKYSDEMCFECHISNAYLAAQTDFLRRNPHDNHNTDLECYDCHISHGEQIDYCSQCHDNGGQLMVGDEIVPRGTIQ